MAVSAQKVAGEVLEVIPLVTRRVAADLRKSQRSMKLAYVGLLGMVAKNTRSLGELSDFHAVSMPTMSKTITTIENLGWVARSRSTVDRRVVMIKATPAGRAALKEVYDLAVVPISEILASLPATQLQELSDALKILRNAFADDSLKLSGESPSSSSVREQD
jgi:DNA-binding MarR family transcriptional regulator